MIQTSLRTSLKLHTPAFLACAAFSLLPLLPSLASVLSLFAGFRLLSPPCVFGWSALSACLFVVLVGAGGSLSCVGLVCFVGVAVFVCLVWRWVFFCLFVLSVSGWSFGSFCASVVSSLVFLVWSLCLSCSHLCN